MRRRVMIWMLAASGLLLACAPNLRTVVSMSVGQTGCPRESLAVFDYHKEVRTWMAVCRDKLYVCSSAGGASCTLQDSATHDPEMAQRAILLLKVPQARRVRFVDYDIMSADWETYSRRITTVIAMTAEQDEDIDDLDRLLVDVPAALNAKIAKCIGKETVVSVDISVKMKGTLSRPKCLRALTRHEYFVALREKTSVVKLAPSLNALDPLPRPSVASPPAEPETAPDTTPASKGSPELDASIRAWLDSIAADVLGCTAAQRLAVQVDVDASGAAEISLAGPDRGTPVEGCVQAAVVTKRFSAGPATVVHLLNRATLPKP